MEGVRGVRTHGGCGGGKDSWRVWGVRTHGGCGGGKDSWRV